MTTTRRAWRRRAPPVFATADLHGVDWRSIVGAGAGARRSADAPRAALERRSSRRKPGVEVIGDIELFCRERRRAGARRAVRRHHRHQRQIDDDRADRASRRFRRNGRTARRQYRHRRSCRLSRRKAGRVHVIECSSYQIDLAPSLDPSVGILINLSEDHLDRHGTMDHYAAVKERLVAGVPPQGTAIVGVDDEWCRAVAERLHGQGKRVVRISVRNALSDGLYVEEQPDHARVRRRRRADRRASAASARCAGCTTRRTPPAPRPPRWRSVSSRRRSRPGCARFPGSRTAWRKSAAAAPSCSSTIPRRPTPIPRRRRSPASTTFSGSPAASRRPAASRALRGFFPRIRKAYLIGEAAAEFAATLGGGVPHEIAGTLDKALAAAARDAEAQRRASRWYCCRRPAPRSTNTAISRSAATRSGRWCGRCRGSSDRRSRSALTSCDTWE